MFSNRNVQEIPNENNGSQQLSHKVPGTVGMRDGNEEWKTCVIKNME
jgi:hypothetical protein